MPRRTVNPLELVSDRPRRVRHERYESRLASWSVVQVVSLPVVEVLDGGVARDLLLAADCGVLRAVDSSKGHLLILIEDFCCGGVLWLCGLAVATPGGIEHD